MRTQISITPTGKTLILLTAILPIFSILFSDKLLLTASTIPALTILSSFLSAKLRARSLKRSLKIKPEEANIRLVAGSSATFRAMLEADKQWKFFVKHPLSSCNIKPQPSTANSELTLEFTPIIAGIYNTEHLEIKTHSRLKAFTIKIQAPFKTNLTVIPRIIPTAIRALELIAALGTTAYETPIQTIGKGTEYAETREYMPGDDPRRLDWKATARLQKLMVKQFHQEVGGGLNLVYDRRAAGPYSRDQIATIFLENAITLTQHGAPYSIILVDENTTLKTFKFKDAKLALLAAIKYALQTVEADYQYLYDLIDPQTTRELKEFFKILGEEPTIKKGIIPTKPKEPMNIIAVTCLLGDLTWLMDLHETAEKTGGSLKVHVPHKIWLDSPTLEQAYIDYERQMKIIATLRRRGIEILFKKALTETFQNQ